MRGQLLKLQFATKAERRIGEILKRNRIKFKVHHRIGKYEVDFLIGRVVIELDGDVHKEINQKKDSYLANLGLVPIHFKAREKSSKAIEKELLYFIKYNNSITIKEGE